MHSIAANALCLRRSHRAIVMASPSFRAFGLGLRDTDGHNDRGNGSIATDTVRSDLCSADLVSGPTSTRQLWSVPRVIGNSCSTFATVKRRLIARVRPSFS
jgi:hypothetical protein